MKTPEEYAKEVGTTCDHGRVRFDCSPCTVRLFADAIAAARRDALEEATKVAEDFPVDFQLLEGKYTPVIPTDAIAAAIRALLAAHA